MTPQEQVKMLREALGKLASAVGEYRANSAANTHAKACGHDYLCVCSDALLAEARMVAAEALAATAPPLPFGQRTAESGANLLTYNGHAIAFDDISGNERAAVVACLNALAEKENAR